MGNISVGSERAKRGRILLYAFAFSGAFALDMVTPIGIADWLINVLLVWLACVFGTCLEMRLVFLIGTFTVLGGLWASPTTVVPFWMGAMNRLVAIVVMWIMLDTAERGRAAEEAKRKAEAEIKILRGLLPICCVCKSMKSEDGRWHRLEAYLTANSEVRLTHGYYPPCASKAMDELAAERAHLEDRRKTF
jgi:hypothetical protein